MTFRTVAWATASLLAVSALAGLRGVRGRPAEPDPAAGRRLLTVETVAVRPTETVAARRTHVGVVKAARASELSFDRTGRVMAILVAEGERVERDQPLARLDVRNLEAKRRELQARRAQTTALLSELEAGPRSETIAAARAEVKQFESELALQRADLQRHQQLVPDRLVSLATFDSSQYGTQAAAARFKAAQARLKELEQGTRPEKLAAQQAVLEQLEASLTDLTIDIEKGTLQAPFRGTVARRYADEGAVIAPGDPLLRVVESDQLEAWIGLPVSTAASFASGQRHQVIVAGARYAATVKALLPELDPATRTRSVLLQLDAAAADHVVPAEVARLEVSESISAEGFSVPTTALARGGRGLWSVYVVEAQQDALQAVVARREVEVLHTAGSSAVIRGTLQRGERVIATGIHRIVPGQKVRIAEGQSTAQGDSQQSGEETSVGKLEM